MIAVDTNILVYAHRLDSEWNDQAYRVLGQLRSSRAMWAIPWSCIHEFYAIVTHPRIFPDATPPERAMMQIAEWIESPGVVMLAEGPRYLDVLRRLALPAGITRGAIHDARIAALCLYHGVDELWTADRDFSRYPALKVRNPLIGG